MQAGSPPEGPSAGPGVARTKRQWQARAELAVARGTSMEEVLAEMVRAGCPEPDAREAVQNAVESQRKSANKLLGCSTAFMLAGIIVTAGTYSAAVSSPSGGTYFIWWGAILVGAVGAAVGLHRRLRLP